MKSTQWMAQENYAWHQALKKNGVIYMSFKYGDFEGVRNERYLLLRNYIL